METKQQPDRVIESDIDREIANAPKDIPGWGIDNNPENDPTYPMKSRNGADHERLNYEKPTQQPIDIEILHSNERPSVTRIFGTSTPPKGLSGMLRRYAFKHSESTYAHWVPLMVADRIGVIEGYIDDFRNGIIPNPFAERGWAAEWKYNRKGFIKNIAIGVAVTTAVIVVLSRRKQKRRRAKLSL